MVEPVLEMVQQGGWVLVGIILVSVIAWSLIVWEALRLYQCTRGGWSGIKSAVDHLQRGDSVDYGAVERSGANLIGRLLYSNVFRQRMDRNGFEAQIMPLLNSEAVIFQRTLRLVAVLAATMPLLGLLGTVLGMIQTFNALTDRGTAEIDALAGGISKALITTQAGLVIAVPILLVNDYLGARIRRYLDMSSVMLKRIETSICDRPV